MTVGVQNHLDYVGTDVVSSYAYTFRIFEPTDMSVSVRDMATNIEQVLTYLLHFTVSGANDPNGGFVTLMPGFSWMNGIGAFRSGWALRLKCIVPLTQEIDFINQSRFYPEIVEDGFDKLTRMIQQVYGSVQAPTGPLGVTLPFPEPGKVIGWNADGTGLVNYSLAGSGGGVIGTTGHMARYTADNTLGDSIALDNGTTITILPASAPVPIDPAAWDLSLFRVGKKLATQTVEIGQHIQVYVPDTASPTSYEKVGLLIYAQTAEPSVAPLDHDLVALDSRAGILPGNLQGRCWGMYSEPNVALGADGLAYGLEISLGNNGSSEPEGGTALSKYGIYINSDRGLQPGTQAIWIGNRFHKGICASATSFVTSFIELDKIDSRTDVYRVKNTGQTLIGDLPNNGTLADYNPAIYGALAVNQMITVPDAITNRNVLVMFSDGPTAKHRIGAGVYQPGTDPYWPVTLESGGFEVLRATVAGVTEFPDRGAVGVKAPAGKGWLRYNDTAKAFEASVDTGNWISIGGGSGGSIGGSGVINQVAKFVGSTTTLGASTIFDDGTSVLVGLTTPTDAAHLRVEVEKNQNDATGLIVRNTNVSSADIFARANFVARSGPSSNDIAVGVTAPFYTPTGAIGPSTGFIYTGTLAAGGLTVQTAAGAVRFAVGTGGAQTTFTINADGALSLAASAAAPGPGKMRFSGSAWQIDNGAGYVDIGGGGGSGGGGWQDDGTTIRPITLTDTVVVGFASSDIVDPGALIANGFLYAVSAQTNAVVAAIGFDGSTATVRVASGVTGTATPAPLAFTTFAGGINQVRMQVQVNGNVGINTTLDAGYKLDVNGSMRTGNLTVVGTLTGNASGLTGLGNLDASTCFTSGMVPIIRGGTNAAGYGINRVLKYNGTSIVDSALFDDGLGNVMIGQTVADASPQSVFMVHRTQPTGTWGVIRNNDTGATSYAAWVARVGPPTSQNDISMGVTSSGYVNAVGISAQKAFIRAGAQTTGLVLHSDVGAISFQVASTSNLVQIQAGGNLACVGAVSAGGGFVGDGSQLTGIPGSAITGGAIPDSALSSNVALRSPNNTFSGVCTFTQPMVCQGNINFASGFGIAAGSTAVALAASAVAVYHSGQPVADFSTSSIHLWIDGANRTLHTQIVNIAGTNYQLVTYA